MGCSRTSFDPNLARHTRSKIFIWAFICSCALAGEIDEPYPGRVIAEADVRNDERTGQRVSVKTEPWEKTFALKHYLKGYSFPEELVSYPLTFPPGAVKSEHLKLVCAGQDEPVTYQLSEVVTDAAGYLKSATLSFRTDLPDGSELLFVATCDPNHRSTPSGQIELEESNGRLTILANLQQAQVPSGNRTFTPPKLATEVPAPLLATSREREKWLTRGSFVGPDSFRVKSIRARTLEHGSLFVKHRVEYEFTGGQKYTMDITIQHNEQHVLISEYMDGFDREDKLAFKLSYGEGIAPDARLVLGNVGRYAERSGAYDRDVDEEGKLPYSLSIWSLHVWTPHSTVFYHDKNSSDSAIIFVVDDPHEWQTSLRYFYTMVDKPENLYFWDRGGDQYMTANLAACHRKWAVSTIPRSEVVVSPQSGNGESWYANRDMNGWNESLRGGGPGERLFQKAGAFSLDWVKDLVFEWDEAKNVYYHRTEPMTYEDFVGAVRDEWSKRDAYWSASDWQNVWQIFERGFDIMAYGAKPVGRSIHGVYSVYASSRDHWTQEQREHVRSFLVFLTAVNMFRDDNVGTVAMVGGHPNFLIESIYPGIFAAIFPNHPYSSVFRDTYRHLLEEFLYVYSRMGLPEYGALGGRYNESLACYSFASMQGILHNLKGFHQFDGTMMTDIKDISEWLSWHMNMLITASKQCGDNGLILTPPSGAHAQHTTWEVLREFGEFLHKNNDELGEHILWCVTGGKKGRKPPLKSVLYEDYGPILRYDFAGPNETWVNLEVCGEDRDKRPGYMQWATNYRWGRPMGVVYYAAKGRNWSWNKMEATGDRSDIRRVSALELNGKPMWTFGRRELDESPFVFADLGSVQYFRTPESDGDYKSRSVMMVRDDFLVIYDDLASEDQKTTFHWRNEWDGVRMQVFDEPDFTKEVYSKVDNARFPIQEGPEFLRPDWQYGWKNYGLTELTEFSVRFSGVMTDPSFKKAAFYVRLGEHDWCRLTMDGTKVLEGGKDARGSFHFAKGKEYEFEFEYVHRGGEPYCQLFWSDDPARAQTNSGWVEGVALTWRDSMPAIHALKDGSGDNLHIIEPRERPALEVTRTDYGAAIGDGRHVFVGDRVISVRHNDLQFEGRTGYAEPGHIALIEGTMLTSHDLGVAVQSGEFGLSAKVVGNRIVGRIAGKSGGIATITVPKGLDLTGRQVVINGSPTAATIEGNVVTFDVDISQADGSVDYEMAVQAKTKRNK